MTAATVMIALVVVIGSPTIAGATWQSSPVPAVSLASSDSSASQSTVGSAAGVDDPSPLRRFDERFASELAARVQSSPVSSAAADAAAAEATDQLEEAPFYVDQRCGSDAGVEVCMRRRVVADTAPSLAEQTGETVAEVRTSPATIEPTGVLSEACDGTGADGFRVQPVYAYIGTEPDPAVIDIIEASIMDMDASLGASAARTGGDRSVHWVTDSGAGGCKVMLKTAQITSGAADFGSLMSDLQSQGVVPPLGDGTVKHLVWTEGEIVAPAPGELRSSSCGLGEHFTDDTPLNQDDPNVNLVGTRAAIDDRCWGRYDGGSVPLHEFTHTLGAVQQTAPNYANDGHCDDERDLMCYGPGMRLVCSSSEALLDCNNDDYFNTDPLVGQYLCRRWNTSDSLYLDGWDVVQAPRAVRNLSVSASIGRITVKHAGTASCYGADYYRVTIAGRGSYDTTALSRSFNLPAGTWTVTVTPHSPYGNVFGTPRSTKVVVPANRVPVGKMVLSLTDGRGYGMLGWAIDPDTGAPVRMRVTIPGVVSREYDWNYRWADMPAHTGWKRTEALLFLAQLPPGTHQVCFDAKDANTGAWTRLDCRTHRVK